MKVLINDRIDVALATDADGVHVGQDDIPAAVARRLLGRSKILGVSVKTVDQAQLAETAGADYLGAGASTTFSENMRCAMLQFCLASMMYKDAALYYLKCLINLHFLGRVMMNRFEDR